MTVVICTLEMHLPSATSLKGKRQILKGLIDRLRHRFNVAVAEIGDHDLWQRAAIGVVCIGHDRRHTLQVIDRVIAAVRGNPDISLLRNDVQLV
ncbi:MAG: DUF503 domain-containing protein [Nitrospirota bacterium]